MASLDDLRRRHELSPDDASVALALADAHQRRNEPALARDALQHCLLTRHERALEAAGSDALLAELVALPAPPRARWRRLHTLALASFVPAAELQRAPPRIVGSCLLEPTWTPASFAGRGLERGAASHPVTLLLALSDGRLLMVDAASGAHAELFDHRAVAAARRSHPPELRQFDLRVDALGQSVAYRDPPGPFVALCPQHAAPHAVAGRTCMASCDETRHWLMGGLHGDLTLLTCEAERVVETRWSLQRADAVWGVGCGADGSVTTLHDATGLEVRAAVGSDELVHQAEDARLMSGRARVASDGARVATLVRGVAALDVYAWREALWTEVEIALEAVEGWSHDARLQHAVAWDRHGELTWLELDAGRCEAMPALERAPQRVWPAADGRFAVAIHLDRIEILG